MAYWVKRIKLKNGKVVNENELSNDENFFEGIAPVVGDVINVTFDGRTFPARVIWGNWPGRNDIQNQSNIVPIRVEEI